MINAGVAHAIGAGCTILEIQEPTDFTVQPEYWCGDQIISDQERYMGLDKRVAMSAFNFDLVGESVIKNSALTPRVEMESAALKKENLISYDDTTYFALNRYSLKGDSLPLPYGPSVWIVLSGAGRIAGDYYRKEIKQGDYFYLPFAAHLVR